MPDRLTAIEKQYAALSPDIPRRIHILGLGGVGKLVAHSLRATQDPPPVSLILHRYSWYEKWEKSKRQITLKTNDVEIAEHGFEVEVLPENLRAHGVEKQTGGDPFEQFGLSPHEAAEALKVNLRERQAEGGTMRLHQPDLLQSSDDRANSRSRVQGISSAPIYNLIVTTKAALTVPALLPIRSRITPDSTICFLQNGMGIIDDVNTRVFPDPETRPNYIQGVVSHGVNVPPEVARRDPFYAVHAGQGTIALGIPLKHTPSGKEEADTDQDWSQSLDCAPSTRHLLRTLTKSPVLCAVCFTPMELFQLQLEKLAVNSVINPLTALMDARNGNLLHNFALTRTMRLMLAETSHVMRGLPELQGIPSLGLRFGADRLEALVVALANKTAGNISSMLADVRAGRKTEIEYINGYIVRRGEEVGFKALVNYAMMQAVIGKAQITQREVQEEVPVAGEPPKRWS